MLLFGLLLLFQLRGKTSFSRIPPKKSFITTDRLIQWSIDVGRDPACKRTEYLLQDFISVLVGHKTIELPT